MKQDKPLTQLQHNFVMNYIKNGFNAYRAALDAGYSESFATVQSSRLPSHPAIKPRLEKALARVEDQLIAKLGITYEWKARKLKRVVDKFIPDDDEEVMIADRVKVGLSALAELNKMQGDYAPDKRLSVTVDTTKEKLLEVKRQYEEF